MAGRDQCACCGPEAPRGHDLDGRCTLSPASPQLPAPEPEPVPEPEPMPEPEPEPSRPQPPRPAATLPPQPRRSPRPRPWDETLNRWLIDTQEQHPALSALAFVLVFLCLVYVQVRYICPTKPPHGAPFPEW